jgi:hypothetical protein
MAPFLIFYLPSRSPKPNESVSSKLRHMDWLGIVLIAAVYTTYTLALTFGGAQWAWDNYRFILMAIFCGLTLLGFIITQYFTILTTQEHRLFPGQFLRSCSLILIFIATSASICTLFLGTYYVSSCVLSNLYQGCPIPNPERCYAVLFVSLIPLPLIVMRQRSDLSADSLVLPICSIRFRYYGSRPVTAIYQPHDRIYFT